MRNKLFLSFLMLTAGCSSGGIIGLPGPQDGTWLASPTTAGATVSAYLLVITQDKIVRINLNGIEWTISQSFVASRSATDITWKTIAVLPTGASTLLPSYNTEFDVVVALQADGTLTGTIAQGISTIPGIASIPTSTTAVVMRKI
jgi:hypothetical protein